jgi:hypothetical protein
MALVSKHMPQIQKVVSIVHRQYGVNQEDVLGRTIELLISSPFDPDKSSFKHYINVCVKHACYNIYDGMRDKEEFVEEYSDSYIEPEFDIKDSELSLKSECERLLVEDRPVFDYILGALKGDIKVTKRRKIVDRQGKDLYYFIKESGKSIKEVVAIMQNVVDKSRQKVG